MRNSIRPGHDLRNVTPGGGPVGAHIGADVGKGPAAQRENSAVAGTGDLKITSRVAGMAQRHQILAPVLYPLHRTPNDPSRKWDQKVFGIEFAARAETAADIVFKLT